MNLLFVKIKKGRKMDKRILKEKQKENLSSLIIQAARFSYLDKKTQEEGMFFPGDSLLLQKEKTFISAFLRFPNDYILKEKPVINAVFSRIDRRLSSIQEKDFSVLQADKKDEKYQSMLSKLCDRAFFLSFKDRER